MRVITAVVVMILLFMLWAVLAGFPVKWLWNWLMPTLFQFPRITFYQAVGLIFLSRCLFGGLSSGKKD